MLQLQRHSEILKVLEDKEFVSIAELSEKLNVSHMTIRRDIEKLEADYRVAAVKGGVKAMASTSRELPRTHKAKIRHPQKVAIANAALPLIGQAKTLYLDAGTTTAEIAFLLEGRSDVVVITNDIAITSYLMENGQCEVYCTGGKLDHENGSFVGQRAADAIRSFNIDLAFVSTSGFSANGISTPAEDKVTVKQAIAQMAKRTVLVSDSAKYGNISLHNALPINVFEALVTDNGIQESDLMALETTGLTVHVA